MGRTAKPADAAPADETVDEAPKPRTFELADDLTTADGEPVVRVSFGCDPYISLGNGQSFTTVDEKLAEQLAAMPELKETTP